MIDCFQRLVEIKTWEPKLSRHISAVQRKEMKDQANPFLTAKEMPPNNFSSRVSKTSTGSKSLEKAEALPSVMSTRHLHVEIEPPPVESTIQLRPRIH